MLPAFAIVIIKRFPASFLTNPAVYLRQLAANGVALVPKRGFLFNYSVFYPMRFGALIWNGAGLRKSLLTATRVILENIYGRIGNYLSQHSENVMDMAPPAPMPAMPGPDELIILASRPEVNVIALELVGGAIIAPALPRFGDAQCSSYLIAPRLNDRLWDTLRRIGKPVAIVGGRDHGCDVLRELLAKEGTGHIGTGRKLREDIDIICLENGGYEAGAILYVGPEVKAWIDRGCGAFHLPYSERILAEYGGRAGEYVQALAGKDRSWGYMVDMALRPWFGFGERFPSDWTGDRVFFIRAVITPVICLLVLRNLLEEQKYRKKVHYEGNLAPLCQNLHGIFVRAAHLEEGDMEFHPESIEDRLAALKPYDDFILAFLADHLHTWPVCIEYAEELAHAGDALTGIAAARMNTCRNMLAYLHKEGHLTANGLIAGMAAPNGGSLEQKLDQQLDEPFAATGFANIANVLAPHKDSCLQNTISPIGIHLHIHDGSVAQEFAGYLRAFGQPFDLWITYSSSSIRNQLQALFSRQLLPFLAESRFIEVPNRGRDIAPWLAECGQACNNYALFCHIHAKKSVHLKAGGGDIWRKYLLDNLLEQSAFAAIANAFAADELLGCIFPALFPPLRKSPTTLYGSPYQQRMIENILERVNLPGPITRRELFFPAGTMLWYRPKALMPLFTAGLTYDDFPPEPLPQDGTLAHAIERAITLVCLRSGYRARTLTTWPLQAIL